MTIQTSRMVIVIGASNFNKKKSGDNKNLRGITYLIYVMNSKKILMYTKLGFIAVIYFHFRNSVHGECWRKHKWITVLHLHR